MTLKAHCQYSLPGFGTWKGSNRSESPETAELEGGRDPGEVDQEQDPPQRGRTHPGEHQSRGGLMVLVLISMQLVPILKT